MGSPSNDFILQRVVSWRELDTVILLPDLWPKRGQSLIFSSFSGPLFFPPVVPLPFTKWCLLTYWFGQNIRSYHTSSNYLKSPKKYILKSVPSNVLHQTFQAVKLFHTQSLLPSHSHRHSIGWDNSPLCPECNAVVLKVVHLFSRPTCLSLGMSVSTPPWRVFLNLPKTLLILSNLPISV